MKKGFVFFMFLMVTVFPSLSYAEDIMSTDSPQIDSVEATQSAMPDKAQDDEYTLPYPGLLPDNPLYVLKVARDGLVGLLITNAQKKASFSILQADKRLAASKALIEKDKSKYAMAGSTLSKAENYMEEAVLKTQEAKKEGLETNELEITLKKSVHKHKKVVAALVGAAPKDQQAVFTNILKRVTSYEKSVDSFVSKKQAK
jgi:hypothetical protein